jgi:hypothetical protein
MSRIWELQGRDDLGEKSQRTEGGRMTRRRKHEKGGAYLRHRRGVPVAGPLLAPLLLARSSTSRRSAARPRLPKKTGTTPSSGLGTPTIGRGGRARQRRPPPQALAGDRAPGRGALPARLLVVHDSSGLRLKRSLATELRGEKIAEE